MGEGDGVAIGNSGSINASTQELVDECLVVIGSHESRRLGGDKTMADV